MADTKVSLMPAVTNSAGTDIFPVVQGGANNSCTLSQMWTWMQTQSPTWSGAAPTFNIPQQVGVAEVLSTWGVTDDAVSRFTIENATSGIGSFIAMLKGLGAGTGQALFITGQGTTDTGATPLVSVLSRIGAAGTVGIRPLLTLRNNATTVWTVNAKGALTLAPIASTSGQPGILVITGPANTLMTSGAEANDINFNLARTCQFATTTPATQRAFLVQPPTYSCSAASQTITNAATLAISGAPAAGTNVTLTNAHALWCQAGNAQFDGNVTTTASLIATGLTMGGPISLKSYTVATLPASPAAGQIAYASNAAGNGPCIAMGNGSVWKRCDNVSTTVV